IHILAPVVRGRKGHYRELFEKIRKAGFLKARIDGAIKELTFGLKLDRYKVHDIEILIDTLEVTEKQLPRLKRSLSEGLKQGKGAVMVVENLQTEVRYFSRLLMCPSTGISYDEPAPNLFSFNSPYGACPACNGLGTVLEIDINKIIPDFSVSIKKGAITPLGAYKDNWIFKQIEGIGRMHGFDLNTPIAEINQDAIQILLYGTSEVVNVKGASGVHSSISFEG